MKRIIIEVDTDGKVSLETKGFAGHGCKDVTKEIETALGLKESDQNTPEAYTAKNEYVPVKGRWS